MMEKQMIKMLGIKNESIYRKKKLRNRKNKETKKKPKRTW